MGRATFLAQQQRFDVLVAGAGSTGCLVARDAAVRGLSVLLPYLGDIAPGTLSGSSRMIHSGLRYLMRGRLGLVRECLNERTMLCRLAPHLARRAPFVIALSRPVWREEWPVAFGCPSESKRVSPFENLDFTSRYHTSRHHLRRWLRSNANRRCLEMPDSAQLQTTTLDPAPSLSPRNTRSHA
jgi:glycerol-3-phosphate dehydrogenase